MAKGFQVGTGTQICSKHIRSHISHIAVVIAICASLSNRTLNWCLQLYLTECWNQLLTHCLRQGALPTPPRGSVVQESHWPSAPHQRLLLTATHVALAIMNWRVPFAHLRSWSPASTTGALPVFCSNASNFNFLALQTVMVLPAIGCSNHQTYQTCFNI